MGRCIVDLNMQASKNAKAKCKSKMQKQNASEQGIVPTKCIQERNRKRKIEKKK